ncbi:MAG TPA: proton-conducting transporter membrane subunit, partial [Kofleriaceae bacterium]|nr:proton-conducting transporter membrane subunit [Kofleriaceae bacterium]
LAGALAMIGIYGLIRFGTTALPTALERGRPALVALGAASALYGGVLAFGRRACAEVVAYASVSHAGLLMLAFGIGGPHGVAAALVLAVASSLDKSTLFLTLAAPGAPARLASAVGATSLAGLPITAGFAAKLLVLRAALDHPWRWFLIPVVLIATALGIAYAFRAWRGLASGDWARSAGDRGEVAVALGVIVILLGLAPAGLVGLAYQAAAELAGGGG